MTDVGNNPRRGVYRLWPVEKRERSSSKATLTPEDALTVASRHGELRARHDALKRVLEIQGLWRVIRDTAIDDSNVALQHRHFDQWDGRRAREHLARMARFDATLRSLIAELTGDDNER